MQRIVLFLIAMSLWLFSQHIYAQEKHSIPPEVMEKLNSELTKLQNEVLDIQRESGVIAWSPYYSGFAEHVTKTPDVKVTRDKTKVFAGADPSAEVVQTAAKGEEFPVIDRVGEWYGVKTEGNAVGWVRASDVTPPQIKPITKPPAEGDNIISRLTGSATRFRDTFRNNPYIQVSGFSITLGLPPSLEMSFEFK